MGVVKVCTFQNHCAKTTMRKDRLQSHTWPVSCKNKNLNTFQFSGNPKNLAPGCNTPSAPSARYASGLGKNASCRVFSAHDCIQVKDLELLKAKGENLTNVGNILLKKSQNFYVVDLMQVIKYFLKKSKMDNLLNRTLK